MKKKITKSSKGKCRISVTIDIKYSKLLENERQLKEDSYSATVEKALEAYFSPEKEEERLSIINKRLLTLDRSFNRVYDATKVINDILCVFVKSWLLYNPELPQQQRDAQLPQVKRRFDSMLNNIIKNILQNHSTFDLLPSIEKKLKEGDFAKPTNKKEEGEK